MTYVMSHKQIRVALSAASDAIARVNIDQEAREAVAEEVAAALDSTFRRVGIDVGAWTTLASDPLVPCAGASGEPCPEGRVIRIAMHLSDAPDGRSAAWQQRAPYGELRCVTCGAAQFIPGFAENRAAQAATRGEA